MERPPMGLILWTMEEMVSRRSWLVLMFHRAGVEMDGSASRMGDIPPSLAAILQRLIHRDKIKDGRVSDPCRMNSISI